MTLVIRPDSKKASVRSFAARDWQPVGSPVTSRFLFWAIQPILRDLALGPPSRLTRT